MVPETKIVASLYLKNLRPVPMYEYIPYVT